MSRIYWHTHDAEAELRGWERAHLGWLARGPASVAWDLEMPFAPERVAELLNLVVPDKRNYLHARLAECHRIKASDEPGSGYRADVTWTQLSRDVRINLQVSGLELEIAGVRLHTHDVDMNTAIVAGSRPVQLAAKLHGYCEVHAYVEGSDRAWLADVIEEGLRAGLYRERLSYEDQTGLADVDAGWRDVQELLRETDDGPVVTSFSVTDGFPNPSVADWTPTGDDVDGDSENEWERWYDLADDRRWDLGVAGLRRRPHLRLAPATLDVPTFSYPVTVYDLRAFDRDARVRRAAGLEEVTTGDESTQG